MLNILQSMCEGMDDNIEAEAGPDEIGFEEEGMDDEEGPSEQPAPQPKEKKLFDDQKDSLDDIRDSAKIRELKGVPREELSKEEIKLLQKYGLIEDKH